jgi:Protein of unknown function (DUF1236)
MEASMKARLWLCAAALALLAHAGAAAAQSTVTTRETVTTKKTVRLSPPQRTVIYKRVTQQPRPTISSREVVVQKQTEDLAAGSRVPETAGLYDLPDSEAADVPPVDEVAPVPPRQYKYMVVNDQVLLVDPETSQVVEIIRH